MKKYYICNQIITTKHKAMAKLIDYEQREKKLGEVRVLCEQVRALMAEFDDICPGRGDRMADAMLLEVAETERSLMYWVEKGGVQ